MSETDKFAGFFAMLGHELHDFQRLIVDEVFSGRRETLVLIPRGCGKSTLLAAVGLWSLLRKPDAQIVVGAASREQASVLFDIARDMARHPQIAPLVEVTRREIRTDCGWLKVIAADGPKQHGLILDMAIVDELHAHARRDLYDALRTAMLKRPGARMVTISTAGATIDTPLGELRDRAMKLPKVETEAALTHAEGPHLAMLEWRAEDPDDMEQVLAANPASWLTREGLEEQRAAVHPLTFARFHANVWTGGEAPWVMAEAWDACSAEPEIAEGDEVVIGIDASIRRDTTALVVVRRDRDDIYHCQWRFWDPKLLGHDVSLDEVENFVRDLAGHFSVREIVFDRAYAHHMAARLEDEGLPMVEWTYSRMASATSLVSKLVEGGKIRHGGDVTARAHALAAEVREREWGLVISKRQSRAAIDGLVAAAMACERAGSLEPKRRSVYEQRFKEVTA